MWALGGGALLLLGLGGTAMVRRRRRDEQDEAIALATVEPVTVAPVAAVPVAEPVAPVAMPATADARPVVAPRPAMAPSMATTQHRLHDEATLEAMVAAAPSAENPFRTRTKRLRRAHYLLAHDAERHGHAAVAAPAPQTTHAEPTPAAPDRSQTVYRFGGQRSSPGFLKPRTR